VIFLSIYEHNSNLLPWRETGATIEIVRMTDCGDFDYEHLEQLLETYKGINTLKIGSFCAGSNITGNYFDIDRISILCHRYDTLACFDYAGVSPYLPINMNGFSGM
jgi:selenocysteine lyase/cysteine desulfurase